MLPLLTPWRQAANAHYEMLDRDRAVGGTEVTAVILYPMYQRPLSLLHCQPVTACAADD